MTNAATGDVFRVTVHYLIHSQHVYNVYHFLAEGAPDIETDLVNRLAQDVQTAQMSVASNQLVHQTTTSQRISPTLGAPFISSAGDLASRTGDRAQPAGMTQCAQVMQLWTASGGRSARGRIFLPGTCWDHIANGIIQTTMQGFADSLTTHFITPAAAPRWRLLVYSRKLAGTAPPLNAAGLFPVTSIHIDPNPASLHSRRIGSGR